MLDKEYFEQHHREHAEAVGGGSSSTTEVHLQNDRMLKVHRVIEACLGYVVLEAYPKEVNEDTRAARRRPGGTDEVFWDRVALPYEAIAYLVHTLESPDSENPMGLAGSLKAR
jgi:hypothetical protein